MNHLGTLTGLQSMSDRQGSTANWPHGILAPNPRATRAIHMDTLAPSKARGRNGLAKPKSGPADRRITISGNHRTWHGGDARSRRPSGLLLRASY
jgi:hypothetical protein